MSLPTISSSSVRRTLNLVCPSDRSPICGFTALHYLTHLEPRPFISSHRSRNPPNTMVAPRTSSGPGCSFVELLQCCTRGFIRPFSHCRPCSGGQKRHFIISLQSPPASTPFCMELISIDSNSAWFLFFQNFDESKRRLLSVSSFFFLPKPSVLTQH